MRLLTLTETLISLDIIIVLLYTEREKGKSHFCYFTDGKQHKAREKSCTAVVHDMINCDLECPRHDYCIICS